MRRALPAGTVILHETRYPVDGSCVGLCRRRQKKCRRQAVPLAVHGRPGCASQIGPQARRGQGQANVELARIRPWIRSEASEGNDTSGSNTGCHCGAQTASGFIHTRVRTLPVSISRFLARWRRPSGARPTLQPGGARGVRLAIASRPSPLSCPAITATHRRARVSGARRASSRTCHGRIPNPFDRIPSRPLATTRLQRSCKSKSHANAHQLTGHRRAGPRRCSSGAGLRESGCASQSPGHVAAATRRPARCGKDLPVACKRECFSDPRRSGPSPSSHR